MGMASLHKYKTKPLDCWQKAQEMRINHYRDVWEAKERGKILVSGGTKATQTLVAGLGEFEYLGGEPYGATVALDHKLAIECAEAVEARGFARDLCSYMRCYWGSMFLDRGPFGGFVKPDFCLQLHYCDSHGKWYQVESEHLGVPSFIIDLPPAPEEGLFEHRIEYLVSQFNDAIDWMERITGRKYEDERLIEATKNECLTEVLWAKICELNKAIPAPLSAIHFQTLYVPSVLLRHRKEAVEFCEMLLDEVKDRVENQIAALGTERCRLFHDGVPPWLSRLPRFPEEYGAVFIGSYYVFTMPGAFRAREDGSLEVAKTPEEEGISLETREDALRVLAKWYMHCRWRSMIYQPSFRIKEIPKMVEDWHGDGVVIHFNRGCEAMSQGLGELRSALRDRGIPTMVYEGNMADPRDFSEAQVIDRLESFFDSLGLTRL